MADLCRLCINSVDPTITLNIFEETQINILKQVEQIVGITLQDESGLPRNICPNCESMLEDCYKFRVRCQRVQQYFETTKFKHRLKSHNSTNEIDIESNCIEMKNEEPTPINFHDEIDEKVEFITVKQPEYLPENQESLIDEQSNSADIKSIDDVEIQWLEEEDNNLKDILDEMEVIKVSQRRSSFKKKPGPRHICERCGRPFTNRNQCLAHMRRHIGDKPYECKFCPSKFVTNTELKRHTRIHTGERPYACQYCDNKFSDLSTKVQHERSHTNERPYVCKQCGKGFRSAHRLKNHMLIHTGERNFNCILCNKSFQRQTHLTAHFKSKTHKQRENKSTIEKTLDDILVDI